MNYKKILLSILILFGSYFVFSQKGINPVLKSQLDQMMIKDQQYRKLMGFKGEQKDSLSKQFGVPVDSLNKHLMTLQNMLDSSNLNKIEKIFLEQGYPGKTLVGEPSNEVGWYIIQHNLQKIKQYFPMIQKAGENKELPDSLVGKMQDRLLMMNNQEQIYGTQAVGLKILNPKTGEKEYEWIVWPIKDSKNVNNKRKEAGFKSTMEENVNQLGAKWTDLSVDEINTIRFNNR